MLLMTFWASFTFSGRKNLKKLRTLRSLDLYKTKKCLPNLDKIESFLGHAKCGNVHLEIERSN